MLLALALVASTLPLAVTLVRNAAASTGRPLTAWCIVSAYMALDVLTFAAPVFLFALWPRHAVACLVTGQLIRIGVNAVTALVCFHVPPQPPAVADMRTLSDRDATSLACRAVAEATRRYGGI